MKKISIKKLLKNKQLVRATQIKPKTHYLIAISKQSGLTQKDIELMFENRVFANTFFLVLDGKPDDVLAIYEVKK